MAERYAYDTIGHDPLRQLIRELGLTTLPTASSAVVMNGAFLRDEREIGSHFGGRTEKAIEDFRRKAAAMLPKARWHRGFGPGDNRHPWASRTCADILDEVPDPIARRYLEITAHSDMATEPHLTSGLIGLRNVLKSVAGYGAQYSIEGGMEMLHVAWQPACCGRTSFSTRPSCRCPLPVTATTSSPPAAPGSPPGTSSTPW